ncbi:ABC transporter substrate-binding protein [Anoxynatronum buryatiense]|nr:ABC transporter substrate-binding protein [Anoxynatronum buryatiense]
MKLVNPSYQRKLRYPLIISLTLAVLVIFAACDLAPASLPGSADRRIPPLTLLTNTESYDPVRYHAAHQIAAWWRELGFEVEVIPMEFNELTYAVRNFDPEEKDWDAFTMSWTGRVERADPDMFIYSIAHSSQAGIMGNNYCEYRNEAYDALAEAQRRVMNPDVRREVVYAAQEKLAKDVPYVTLFYRRVVQAYRQDRWENMTAMAGEGLYHEWLPFHARPIDRQPLDEEPMRLVIASNQEPSSLNPLTASTVWEWKLLRLMYDKLARVNQYFQPKPWAARDIRQVNDITIDVILREGMTFHDGQPVRPEDVVFTYNMMRERGVTYFAAFLDPIKEVVLLPDRTIRFRLKEPYAAFITMTLAQIPILPEHLWSEFLHEYEIAAPATPGASENVPVPLVGSGPLFFETWDHGKQITFRKDPHYFAADDVALDELVYSLYPDTESLMQALLSGEADMTGVNLEPDQLPVAEAFAEIQVIQVPDLGFHYLGFNCSRPPFDDPVMRQAAAMAMDLEHLVSQYLNGMGDVGGAGQPISTGNVFWKNPTVTQYPFDITKAREMLQEAGYTWDEQDRICWKE